MMDLMIRLSKYCLLFGIGISLFSQCTNEDEGSANPAMVRVYTNDHIASNQNVQVLSVFGTEDDGFLVFGLCSDEPIVSTVQHSGYLYILKLDKNGQRVWDLCDESYEGGTISNILKISEGTYVTFWSTNTVTEDGNYRKYPLEIAIDTQGGTISRRNEIKIGGSICENCDFITRATQTDDGGFMLLGMGTDNLGAKIVFITRLDNNYALVGEGNLSQLAFDPKEFEGLANDDITILTALKPYMHIYRDDNKYFFTGPVSSAMNMAYVGEPNAIYSDELYWIASVNPLSEQSNKASIVVQDPTSLNSPAYFIPEIDMTSESQSFNTLTRSQEIYNLETLAEVLVKKLSPENVFLLVGTSTSGQIILYIYDLQGTELNDIIIGQSNSYEVAGFVETNNQKDIVIIGTTLVNISNQRVFFIKIPKNTLGL